MTGLAGSAPSRSFWQGKRVLLTGHTGFKGSWLSAWLGELGAEVLGLSLPDRDSVPNLRDELGPGSVTEVLADIGKDGWQGEVETFAPEVVLHLAAQALVPVGYNEPLRTFATNVHGTAMLLDALSRVGTVRAAVLVTTDKVYDIRQPLPFAEQAYLGGTDPYSASKAAMELLVNAWPGLRFPLATARAGNVIGGGDWSAERLLPDAVRSWSTGSELVLRRPTAVRPWQHVLEPLRGYLLLAEHLALDPTVPHALNLGPDESQCVQVDEVVRFAADYWAEVDPQGTPPEWRALEEPPIEETQLLVLDSSLARASIGWSNVLDWRAAVRRTVDWHRAHAAGSRARDLVTDEISQYESTIAEGA